MTSITLDEQTLKHLTFPKLTIQYSQNTENLKTHLSQDALNEYLYIFELAKTKPKQAQKSALDFLDQHPHLPEIYNLLSYIYLKLRKISKAEKLIQKNYQKNPHNFFAKINYADQCLRKKKLKKIPAIFENKLSLQALYPNRNSYHFSELLGYLSLMGFYYLK
jgi:predicted Zn-dependent protease